MENTDIFVETLIKRFMGFGVKTLLDAKVEETLKGQTEGKSEKSFTEQANVEIHFYKLFF